MSEEWKEKGKLNEWIECFDCPYILNDKDGYYCGHNHEDGTKTEHEGNYKKCPLFQMEK